MLRDLLLTAAGALLVAAGFLTSVSAGLAVCGLLCAALWYLTGDAS